MCLLLITTVALCACTQQDTDNPVQSSNAASQEQSISSTAPSEVSSQQKEVVVSIEPPDGWKPVNGSVLPAQYMKNTASFMVKEERFTGDTLNEVVDEALEIYSGSCHAVNGHFIMVAIMESEGKEKEIPLRYARFL